MPGPFFFPRPKGVTALDNRLTVEGYAPIAVYPVLLVHAEGAMPSIRQPAGYAIVCFGLFYPAAGAMASWDQGMPRRRLRRVLMPR
jgi:hypothetical protein